MSLCRETVVFFFLQWEILRIKKLFNRVVFDRVTGSVRVIVFFFLGKIDQKNNCRFGEIMASTNMSIWGDFWESEAT